MSPTEQKIVTSIPERVIERNVKNLVILEQRIKMSQEKIDVIMGFAKKKAMYHDDAYIEHHSKVEFEQEAGFHIISQVEDCIVFSFRGCPEKWGEEYTNIFSAYLRPLRDLFPKKNYTLLYAHGRHGKGTISDKALSALMKYL